ncbi:MAG: hypothetical protein ACLFUS_02430 [Candidatus Sumerlaeia bacterium]
MSPGDNPQAPEEQPLWETRIARVRLLWQICLFLPFLYLLLCLGIENIWKGNPKSGLWPTLSEEAYRSILSVLGGLCFGAEVALLLIRQRFALIIEANKSDLDSMARVYGRRTFLMAACADFVSFMGLIAFLLRGHWIVLSVFCAASYLLYAQAYPRASKLVNRE